MGWGFWIGRIEDCFVLVFSWQGRGEWRHKTFILWWFA